MRYEIRFRVEGYSYIFDSEEAWEARLDFIAENLPYDIDVIGRVAIIDDGDPEDAW